MADEDKMFLYYCQWTRQAALEATNAYSDGFITRLIPTFDNIKEDAERAAQVYWEAKMSSSPCDGEYYDGDFAESAVSAGVEAYENLKFVKQQLIGLSIAGLYHLWERTLKQFIAKEFNQRGIDEKTIEELQKSKFDGVVKLLKQFNYDITVEPYYEKLNEMRLVVNAVKHGAGKSLDELIKAAPRLFDDRFLKYQLPQTSDDLTLSLDDFKLYSRAVVGFWMRLPQKMIIIE